MGCMLLHSTYCQGNTLELPHRHWRQAKIGKRFRWFFRYDSNTKVIIYTWINDGKAPFCRKFTTIHEEDKTTLMDDEEPEPFYQIDANDQVIWTDEGRMHYQAWFGRFGIRLETIQTAEDLHRARRIWAPGFIGHLVAIASNGPPSLERHLLIALARGDNAEYQRLLRLVKRRNALGLQVIGHKAPDP